MRKGMSSKEDALNRDESRKLWQAARKGDEHDRLIFVLAHDMGLRAGEIANLDIEWMAFQAQKIQIPKEFSKTDASARSIPFGNLKPRVKKEIERYFDYHDQFGLVQATINLRLNRMAERAGLTKNVYPHALRATCALRMAEAGMSTQGLREFFGWSKIATAESYIRHSGRAAERELERIGDQI